MRLGIDAGNHRVKISGDCGLMDFISTIGEARSINLHQVHGKEDMWFEYQCQTGFAGTLALYESEFAGSLMGDSKCHKDTLLRVLIGIHRYSCLNEINDTEFDIVIGQPISKHNHNEKTKLKEMLKGLHTITVNGIEKSFRINRCEVAAEGVSSYFSNPQPGLVRILDIGSATVNYASVLDGRFIDKDSGTLQFGMNTNKTTNLQALTRGIATHTLKKWDSHDKVFVVGGIAEQVKPHLKEYFTNTNVLHPIFNQQYVNPIYANSIAFYIIGVNIYG